MLSPSQLLCAVWYNWSNNRLNLHPKYQAITWAQVWFFITFCLYSSYYVGNTLYANNILTLLYLWYICICTWNIKLLKCIKFLCTSLLTMKIIIIIIIVIKITINSTTETFCVLYPLNYFWITYYIVHFTSHSFGNKMLTTERVPEWLICNIRNPSQGWGEADAQHFCQYPLTVVHD